MKSKFSKNRKIVILFVILLAGLDIAIFISKISRLVGVAILAVGVALFVHFSAQEQGMSIPEYIRCKFRSPEAKRKEKKEEMEKSEETEGSEKEAMVVQKERRELSPENVLASRLLDFFTRGKLKLLFPVMGLLFLVVVPVYNIGIKKELLIGSNDIVMLLVGLVLLFYHRIPEAYKREKDFAVIFFVLLFLIVVLPTTYYAYRYDTTEGGWEDENPDSPLAANFLARPVSTIVKAFGVDSYSSGVTIRYEKNYDDDENPHLKYDQVSIALGCTGLYSVSIFFSGFIAFISIEYKRFDHKVAILLALGIITSYMANLMRMSIIVLVGSYYGSDALIWTHKNLGEVIFVLWILVFWSFMFKYLFDEEGDEGQDEGGEEAVTRVIGLRGVVKRE